jgi:hypothetical protein
MKIAIGINIFGDYKRQDQCIEVLLRLVIKYPEISLYNITFEDEKNYTLGFKPLPLLKTKTKDIIQGSKSEKPIAKEFFDILSTVDCDYFVFMNSDILLTERVIKMIIKGEYETYSFSRHDCYKIESFDKIIPFRIEIAGFDTWAVKKDWWIKNQQFFKNYIYAEHLWDVAFALEMYNRSISFIGNKEIYLCHEKHELKWNETSPEALHNSKLWENSGYSDKWHKFIYSYLINRLPHGQFLNPLPDELDQEKIFLKCI